MVLRDQLQSETAIECLTSYQTSGSAQRNAGEPRQAGNGATVARRTCVAGKSGVWPNQGVTSEK